MTDYTRAFFGKKYEDTTYLPQSLRLGRKTFEAGKKLFSSKSLWFNDVDKTLYLIDGQARNYHESWGLLSAIWSRNEAKKISDLFTNSRRKLRWIVLGEMARMQTSQECLTSFITRYIVDDWHRETTEFSIKVKRGFDQSRYFQNAIPLVSGVAQNMTNGIADDLKKLDAGLFSTQREMLETFFYVCNRLRFSAIWSSSLIEQLISVKNTAHSSGKKLSTYLAHRARMAAIHCIDNQDLWNLSIDDHLAGIEDRDLGGFYTTYTVISNTKELEKNNLSFVLESDYLARAWKPGLASNLMNKHLFDLYSPWRLGVHDMVRYILVIASALRSFHGIDANIFRKEPTLLPNVKNALRYVYRKDAENQNQANLRTMKNSKLIIHLMNLLERSHGIL